MLAAAQRIKVFFLNVNKYPLAGICISAMVVLTYWSGNIERLGFESVWSTLAGVLAIALAVTLLVWAVTGSKSCSTIAVALIAVYVFYVSSILEWLAIGRLASTSFHIATIGAMWMLYLKLQTDQTRRRYVATSVNLISMLMLIGTALPLSINVTSLESGRLQARDALPEFAGQVQSDSPDVWHILLDRYAANSTLEARYNFDNTTFTEALRERGFAVNESAFSNYQRTGHSVASTLNGSYLDPLTAPLSGQQNDWVPIYRAMRDNAAIRHFNRMGYRTIFAGSWWEPTRFSSAADETIQIRALPQLARLLIDRSAAGFWFSNLPIPFLDGRADQCFRVNEKVRQLVVIAQQDERKMVFAHFLVPHPPFVLNPDSSCRPLATAIQSSRRDNYVGQIMLANSKALTLIDAILAGPRPAVIVLHSDEGPWPEPYVGYEHGLGTDPVPVPWPELKSGQLSEKFAILMAVRDPGGRAPRTIPQSPVQIYPAIFRDYFQSRSDIPVSRSLIYIDENRLYQFEDISDQLEQ